MTHLLLSTALTVLAYRMGYISRALPYGRFYGTVLVLSARGVLTTGS